MSAGNDDEEGELPLPETKSTLTCIYSRDTGHSERNVLQNDLGERKQKLTQSRHR